jgi:hypothetical protein
VIPILVDNARMPLANQMPPTLAPLDRRNVVEINPIFDTRRLIIAVQKTPLELKVERLFIFRDRPLILKVLTGCEVRH